MDFSPVVVGRLLMAGASLAADTGLGLRGSGVPSAGRSSVAVVHRLSYSTECGVVLAQESNPCLLHWQADSLPPGEPAACLFVCFNHL